MKIFNLNEHVFFRNFLMNVKNRDFTLKFLTSTEKKEKQKKLL